jgi:hypothetical protein
MGLKPPELLGITKIPLTKQLLSNGISLIAPLDRRDATSASQIAFISELRDMLIPGQFWDGTSIKGIFTPVEIASKTQTSTVKDCQKDANSRTLPPTLTPKIGVGKTIGETDKFGETNLEPRLEEPGLEPRLLKLP